jgi:hypothetical protein
MHPASAKFVPRILTDDLQETNDNENLLNRVSIGEEEWVYGYDIEINDNLHTGKVLLGLVFRNQDKGMKAIEVLCIMNLLLKVSQLIKKFSFGIETSGPPLWSSGQSSWLQIQRNGFDSRHYQKKKVVGLERGALSLVSTTEQLLDRKVAAPV